MELALEEDQVAAHHLGSISLIQDQMSALVIGIAALGTAGTITLLAAQAASSAVPLRMNHLVGHIMINIRVTDLE